MLFHSNTFLTHGWSPDGISWSWSNQGSGPAAPTPDAGEHERPRVFINDDGDLEMLYTSFYVQLKGNDASSTLAFKTLQQ